MAASKELKLLIEGGSSRLFESWVGGGQAVLDTHCKILKRWNKCELLRIYITTHTSPFAPSIHRPCLVHEKERQFRT